MPQKVLEAVMIRHFRYVFYRIYRWDLKYSGDRDISAWNAVLGVSFLTLFVIFGVFSLVAALTDPSLARILPKSNLALVILPSIWIGVHYLFLVHGGRLARLEEEFGHETREQRRRGTKLLIATVVLSLALPYAALLGSRAIASVFAP
jgi:hypothetical protein